MEKQFKEYKNVSSANKTSVLLLDKRDKGFPNLIHDR
jgi:hypothetical protein